MAAQADLSGVDLSAYYIGDLGPLTGTQVGSTVRNLSRIADSGLGGSLTPMISVAGACELIARWAAATPAEVMAGAP
jgi:hypothetical protein